MGNSNIKEEFKGFIRELTKEIYIATKIKLLLLTPTFSDNDDTILEKSNKLPNMKYAPKINVKIPAPDKIAIIISFLLFTLNKEVKFKSLSYLEYIIGIIEKSRIFINDFIRYSGLITASINPIIKQPINTIKIIAFLFSTIIPPLFPYYTTRYIELLSITL